MPTPNRTLLKMAREKVAFIPMAGQMSPESAPIDPTQALGMDPGTMDPTQVAPAAPPGAEGQIPPGPAAAGMAAMDGGMPPGGGGMPPGSMPPGAPVPPEMAGGAPPGAAPPAEGGADPLNEIKQMMENFTQRIEGMITGFMQAKGGGKGKGAGKQEDIQQMIQQAVAPIYQQLGLQPPPMQPGGEETPAAASEEQAPPPEGMAPGGLPGMMPGGPMAANAGIGALPSPAPMGAAGAGPIPGMEVQASAGWTSEQIRDMAQRVASRLRS